MYKKISLLCISALMTGSLFANDLRLQMAADYEFIAGTFKSSYAPFQWKQNYAGWNIDNKIALAKDKILNSESFTVKDYQLLVKDLLLSTQDYHVGFSFIHTEKASLPFSVKSAEGKYFIVYIDRSKLTSIDFPFSVGVELVEFDDKPISQAIKEVYQQTGNNVLATDMAIAEMKLTSRSATKLYDVPKGPITIGVKPQGSETVIYHQMIWNYQPEKITDAVRPKLSAPYPSSVKKYEKLYQLMNVNMTANHFSDVTNAENPYGLGNRESVLPALGEKIWESSENDFFNAYIYKNENNKFIGYVRINTYSLSSFAGVFGEGSTPTQEFANIIDRFEKWTDALVIDQLNNPGGSVSHLYGLASMLTTKPLSTPKHSMTLNQSEIAEALELLEMGTFDGSELDFLSSLLGTELGSQWIQFYKALAQFKIDEWNAGKTFTSPHFILGIDKVNPHSSVNYTKPILILTNSLDFSGGDFFPAIMQDNKRATIMGTRTAGAGGYVLAVGYPNVFGLEYFTYTGSIAERVNKQPIENLGVTPDVQLDVTAKDLQSNYVDYLAAVNAQVDKMLG